MRISRLLELSLASAFLLIFVSGASAQTSVYGAISYTDFGFETNNSGIVADRRSAGLTLGGFYNFPIQSRLTAGIDLRTVFTPSNGGADFTGVALRIGLEPRKVPLRPYFQIGGGVVSAAAPTGFEYYNGSALTIVNQGTRHTNVALEIAFGLDIRLTEHFDLRAFDLGAAASGSTNASSGGAFFSSGMVYHLRPR